MGKTNVRLRLNPITGKRDVVVTLSSVPDALVYEQTHRATVELLIGSAARPEELGEIVFEQESD